jgi:predicted nucleic acid-binding protein
MEKPRVYIDSGILILASRAEENEISDRALQELDRDVVYLYSPIVELETVPQPTIHNYPEQVAMLREFFARAERVECDAQAQAVAIREACKKPGLDAADALHVGCAIVGDAEEIVTREKPTNTFPQATGIRVRTIVV